jgi:hypothetical protein
MAGKVIGQVDGFGLHHPARQHAIASDSAHDAQHGLIVGSRCCYRIADGDG